MGRILDRIRKRRELKGGKLKKALGAINHLIVDDAKLEAITVAFNESKIEEALELVKPFWGAIDMILEAAENFAGEKFDDVSDKIQYIGSKVFNTENETASAEELADFREAVQKIWIGYRVKTIVNLITLFTPERIDVEIEKVSAIIDAIVGDEVEEEEEFVEKKSEAVSATKPATNYSTDETKD
jgi:sulfatase maturation enzyme AslB (radical SAM superfamily)